jgi:hypothetical protein
MRGDPQRGRETRGAAKLVVAGKELAWHAADNAKVRIFSMDGHAARKASAASASQTGAEAY